MFLAFLIGASTGFFFTPIALVPVSVLFLGITVGIWGFMGELGSGKLALSALYLVILNVSYLLGALLRRWLARNGRPPDA